MLLLMKSSPLPTKLILMPLVFVPSRKLAALKLKVPITIVCDNARYQKCKLVQELADQLEIELLYLP